MEKFELWYPVKPFHLNQGWGTRGDYYQANGINIVGHNGWDFWAPDSWLVRAAHDGIVEYVGRDDKGGLGIVLVTEKEFVYGNTSAYYKTIYWHLKEKMEVNIFVKQGDRVKVGQVIALADNTGLSTGSHLHFGLKAMKKDANGNFYNIEQNNGYLGAIDPTPYWNKYYAEDYEQVMKNLNEQKTLAMKLVDLYNALLSKLRPTSE